MAYTKTNWVNGGPPAVSAENLNHIEDGIYNADAEIDQIQAEGVFKDSNGAVRLPGDLYLKGHTGPIGYMTSISRSSVSLANATSMSAVPDTTLTLSPGRWIITGSIRYPGNATGVRGVGIRSAGSLVPESAQVVPAVSASYLTRVNCTCILETASTTNVNLGYIQSSGSALSSDFTIRAIRIR